MKVSSIIRIVCWLVIACVLVGVLVWGIGARSFRFNILPAGCFRVNLMGFEELTQGDLGPYSENNAYAVPLGSIDTIKVNWVDGSVVVKPYDGDEIAFEESSLSGIPQKYALRYAVNGRTLTIQYCEPGINWNTGMWNLSKQLEVLVPQTLVEKYLSLSVNAVSAAVNVSDLPNGSEDMTSSELNVTTVSGSIDVVNVSAEQIDLNTTSGRMQADACYADSIQANSVSGAIRLNGTFGSVSTNTVSGASTVQCDAFSPAKVKMDTVSGMSTLVIPDNDGFTARYDTVSGGFSCSFPATISDDKATYGDGSASFSFDSVSGGIKIEKNG